MRLKTIISSLLLLALLSPTSWAFAQDESDDHPGLVEVEDEPSIVAVTSEGSPLRVPYRDRRSDFAFNFGVNNRSLVLSSFRSGIGDLTYKDAFGNKPISQTEITLGEKYNFALGSIGVDLGYGMGSVAFSDSTATTPVDRSLDLTFTSASATIAFDNLTSEPYVVPYFRSGMYTANFSEKDNLNSLSKSGTTTPALFYSAGVLLQLNWLEPVLAYESYRNFGLENSFLDISVTQYSASEASGDPKLGTDPALGIGFRLEF